MKYREVIEQVLGNITEEKKQQINDFLVMLEESDY